MTKEEQLQYEKDINHPYIEKLFESADYDKIPLACASYLCYKIAGEKGWNDKIVPFPEAIALIHSEASEALEDYRNNNMAHAGEELADIVIRVFHYSFMYGYDIQEEIFKKLKKNRERSYRHGGKII